MKRILNALVLPEIFTVFSGKQFNFENSRGRKNRVINSFFRNSFHTLFLLFFVLIMPFHGVGQGISNEAEWNGSGYSLKKVVSNTTIASGVNFSYTILFTAPAGATTVTITDNIPASLVVVSVPTPALVNGVTPSVTVTGSVGSEVVTYSLSSLPTGSASSGSFTIVVKFPEGTTCNGEAARNRAAILIDDKPQYTPFVSTTATAADPWKVVKSILSGPVVNPGGGSCGYLMGAGDTVTYRLSVLKNSPYFGNVVGQQNMSSAVVTDVLPAGAVFVSSTCGIAPPTSGNTITWSPNAGNLDAANPWAYYYCDITVYYPAASFPNGSFVNNQVTLDGTMCGQQVSHTSNETCIEIGEVVANPSAYFKKYINLTNRVPGCQGYYTIIFCNNGNVPLNPFNIDDNLPSGVSVNQIKVFGGNATTTMAVTANSGGNTIASAITTNYFDSGTLGFNVNDLQLQMTGSLPVGDCIYLYIYFTVEPNPTGTVVTNCADFDGLTNSLSLTQTCVSFTVDEGTPHPCVLKDVCSPQSSYEPGNIVRFRLRIQNIGSADISGAGFQDVLNSNFSYVGNETYYESGSYNPACSSGGGIPSGATPWTGVTPNHSGNNLNWLLPDIPSDCQLFYVGYCGYYGTWGLPYYFIEFDVMVDSTAMPGVTTNNYEISGGNLPSSVTSNTVNVLVVASFGQEVEKQVSTDSGSTFSSSGIVTPGGSARYRLNYKNTSNVPVTSVNLIDLLPRDDGTNDWLILNRTAPRGSLFDVTYNNNHSTSLVPAGAAPTPSLSYAPGANICLPPFGIVSGSGCNTTTWSTAPDQNIRIDYGTFILNSNVSVREDFDVTIPASAVIQQIACNDFAAIATADFLLDGVPQSVALTPIAAPPVCVTVDTLTASCCDSVRIEQIQGKCCVRIASECEVKAINVSVDNGTISSMSWNCGTSPTGFVGQSNFTFAPNGCAADMTICFDPLQQGTITVTYTINFQNGEKCEKALQIDCVAEIKNCCDSVRVEPVLDATGQPTCCAKIITECEVDSIAVNINNGTFASTTWNCGTLPAGIVGQSSFTFNANLCAVNMVNCVDPIQSGSVSISYLIYFQNGEQCEKSVKMDCKKETTTCCAFVDFKLKPKWPHFNTQVGIFTITNLDPSSPICSVTMSASPAATFTPGTLVVDGAVSSQTWNSTSVPVSGNLSPAAVNDLTFSLTGVNYHGVISLCVQKCDGTECCFEFKWNKKPVIDIDISLEQLSGGKLVAVSVNPVVSTATDAKVKFVSFGMRDTKEISESNPEFFAISAATYQGDEYPAGLAAPTTAYMSKYNAFFELSQPKSTGENLGVFNLVFRRMLPKLACTLFDEDGNILFSGDINVSLTDSVSTLAIEQSTAPGGMFEFIKLYPNPSNGTFNVTYATGTQREVEIRVINPMGQVIKTVRAESTRPGIHDLTINTHGLSMGLYKVVLYSNGRLLSKSAVVKR